MDEAYSGAADLAGDVWCELSSYGLIPTLLPAIDYQYDPDDFNLANGANGFLYLQWTDESGASQTRYYDGQGSRGDDSGGTLAGDFMKHTRGASAPAWQVATILAHWQQGKGASRKRYQSNSFVHPIRRGYKPISSAKCQQHAVGCHGREWANKQANAFQHLTHLDDAQRPRAQQNRAAGNDVTWRLTA